VVGGAVGQHVKHDEIEVVWKPQILEPVAGEEISKQCWERYFLH
jgi:hypothetical protein